MSHIAAASVNEERCRRVEPSFHHCKRPKLVSWRGVIEDLCFNVLKQKLKPFSDNDDEPHISLNLLKGIAVVLFKEDNQR